MTQRRANPPLHSLKNIKQRSVRGLMLFVLAATLLPVFVISFLQAHARLSHDRAIAHRALLDGAGQAAAQGRAIISSTQQSLARISEQTSIWAGGAMCDQPIGLAHMTMPYVSGLAVVRNANQPICWAPTSSTPPAFLRTITPRTETSAAGVEVMPPLGTTPGNGHSIIIGAPIGPTQTDAAGQILAHLSLSDITSVRQTAQNGDGARLILIDHNGRPLRGVTTTNAGNTFADQTFDLSFGNGRDLGSLTARDGKLWHYATSELVAGRVYVAYLLPDTLLFSGTLLHVATDIALPLIALILAGAGLWYAIHLWAVKPIEDLRRLAREYAIGRFDAAAPDFTYGPLEMAELRDDMTGMANRAQVRDQNLQRASAQKDVIVRELHHRVKNNLQIIVSLIDLETRQLSNIDQRASLERTQGRVAALALIQRLIVELDDGPYLNVATLMDDMGALVMRHYRSHATRVRLTLHAEPILMGRDTIMPLMQFVHEAMINAYQHGFADDGKGDLRVDLYASSHESATLEITDNGTGWDEGQFKARTGHALMSGFARQLGGQIDLSSQPNVATIVRLHFPMDRQRLDL